MNVTSEHSWRPRNLAEIEAQPSPRPSIGGLLYPGRRHVWSGEPESMKTLAALIVAASEIRAINPIVWIDFEMEPAEVVEWLRALGLNNEQLALFRYITPEKPIGTPGVLPSLAETLDGATLVVIDSYTGALALHDLDPNKGQDIERFHRAVVDVLRSQGAAVLILDHLPKSKDNRGRFSIGSERKMGAVDVHLGVVAVQPFGRGRHGVARFEVHKDRPGHLARPRAGELHLDSDPDTHAVTSTLQLTDPNQTGEHDTFRPTALMEKVSRYLEQQAAPVSRNQIETAVRGKRDYLRLAIDVLIAEGHAAEETGARGARLVRSTQPFHPDLAPTSPHFAPGEDSVTSPLAPLLQRGARRSRNDNSEVTSPPASAEAWAQAGIDAAERDRLERLAEAMP